MKKKTKRANEKRRQKEPMRKKTKRANEKEDKKSQ